MPALSFDAAWLAVQVMDLTSPSQEMSRNPPFVCRLDHIGINSMIAGCYTPVMMLGLVRLAAEMTRTVRDDHASRKCPKITGNECQPQLRYALEEMPNLEKFPSLDPCRRSVL